MPDAHPLRPDDPAALGAYRLVGRLGEGNQGVVYLGRDTSGTHVAVKLLHARMAAHPGSRDRFVRELSAAKKVARFCTAQVLDADVAGDHPYIVSEYVAGRSLRSHILDEGPRSGGALERLAIGTLNALAAIHRAGVVHRDFTPHNVLLGPDGPRVIDFGIARALGAVRNNETNNAGTPAYMAPEQVLGEEIGSPADLFAWGSTILFAGTGRPPFGNESVAAVMDRIMRTEPDVTALPEPLRSVVAACLAKDPAQRPTAEQAQARLLGHDLATPLTPPPAFGATDTPEETPAGSSGPTSQAGQSAPGAGSPAAGGVPTAGAPRPAPIAGSPGTRGAAPQSPVFYPAAEQPTVQGSAPGSSSGQDSAPESSSAEGSAPEPSGGQGSASEPPAAQGRHRSDPTAVPGTAIPPHPAEASFGGGLGPHSPVAHPAAVHGPEETPGAQSPSTEPLSTVDPDAAAPVEGPAAADPHEQTQRAAGPAAGDHNTTVRLQIGPNPVKPTPAAPNPAVPNPASPAAPAPAAAPPTHPNSAHPNRAHPNPASPNLGGPSGPNPANPADRIPDGPNPDGSRPTDQNATVRLYTGPNPTTQGPAVPGQEPARLTSVDGSAIVGASGEHAGGSPFGAPAGGPPMGPTGGHPTGSGHGPVDGHGSGRTGERRVPVVAGLRRSRAGLVFLAGAVAVVAATALALSLWPDGGDAATSATGTPTPRASVAPKAASKEPEASGVMRATPHRKRPKPAAGCHTYNEIYGVSNGGTVIVNANICRTGFSGTAITGDLVPNDGYDVCVQLRGHVTGPGNVIISTPIMSSKSGGTHSFSNGPSTRFGANTTRTEDWVQLNVGRCKGASAAWQTRQHLKTG